MMENTWFAVALFSVLRVAVCSASSDFENQVPGLLLSEDKKPHASNNSLLVSGVPSIVVYLSHGKPNTLNYELSSPSGSPVEMLLSFVIAEYPFRGRIIVESLSNPSGAPLLVMEGGLARNFLEVKDSKVLVSIVDSGFKKNKKAVIAFDYVARNVKETPCGGNVTAIEETIIVGIYPNKSESGTGVQCNYRITGSQGHLTGLFGVLVAGSEGQNEFKIYSKGLSGTPIFQTQAFFTESVVAVNSTDVGASYTDNSPASEDRGFTLVFMLVKPPKGSQVVNPAGDDERRKTWLKKRPGKFFNNYT